MNASFVISHRELLFQYNHDHARERVAKFLLVALAEATTKNRYIKSVASNSLLIEKNCCN